MGLPVVAIVGRPNVGKSSLFNRLLRRRTSIVEATPGVTRDRVASVCAIDDHYFELVDTGGHGVVDRDDLTEHVERQIRFAIERADLIFLVVDAREGVTPLDTDTAELLRRMNVHARVRLLANKVDDPRMEHQTGEFTRLGFGEPTACSAVTGTGDAAVMELIQAFLSDRTRESPPDPAIKVAVVGKRNAGKSTLINALAGEDRIIVSEIPGTTRDSIDVCIEKDGRTILMIDTAGVRKKRSMRDDIEFYALTRAEKSIRRADVVLLLIDSTVPVGQVDKRLARTIYDEFKPCIFVVNKWDLAKDRTSTEEYGKYLTKVIPWLDFIPIAFTSAIDGKNVWSVLDLAAVLVKQARERVSTGVLNQTLQEALAQRTPKPKRGAKAPKVLYATQVSIQPPTIAIFVNRPGLVTPDYERFLLNRFRETLPFEEIPIRLVFRARRREPTGV